MNTTGISRQADRTGAALGGYLFDERRARPLPADEQRDLALLYQRTRDPRVAQRLVETNLRLVFKVALELDRSGGRDVEDLVQEGTLGLLEAIEKFDATKETRLTTYAVFWIRAYIIKHTMDHLRVVRVVRTRAERQAFFHGASAWVDRSFDEEPVPGQRPLSELLPDPAPPADEQVAFAERVGQVRGAAACLMRALPERDGLILRERVLADEPTSRNEIGRRVALSGERVRQIEINLCAAIRDRLTGGAAAA
jgi:RNA polymerase sigma-32 factor